MALDPGEHLVDRGHFPGSVREAPVGKEGVGLVKDQERLRCAGLAKRGGDALLRLTHVGGQQVGCTPTEPWSLKRYIPASMKAVIVAAGYGSRFLPASKTVPKEMFPVLDRPAIDFILEELRESGIDDILFVTSRRKRALADYVDREVELEQVFESEGATAKQRSIAVPPGRFFFLRQ